MLQHYSDLDFIKLRKARIEQVFSSLNNMQQQAVLHTEGPLLLLAGAGSGKTTVLINRILNLVRFGKAYHSTEVPPYITDEDYELLEEYLKHPIEGEEDRIDSICADARALAWQILAITFTNKAAKELKERLERVIGPEANDVWAATFHSACVRILRRDIEKLGFDRSFTIYDTSDSERLMKEILKSLDINEKMFPPKTVLGVISRAKDRMILPDEFASDAGGDYRAVTIAKAYAMYQKRLKEANAVDFDDIILHTVTLLQEYPDVRGYYQKKFRYVLVDEYQDTNHAQYLLASLLAGGYNNMCVVGDDDQSIYRFRGATVENILEFEEQFPGCKVIRLEQNYRSTDQILSVANHIIANNKSRKAKRLWTENQSGAKPKVHCAQNEMYEANYIADQILKAYRDGQKWCDFAVLYRINAQSNQIEASFKKNGIPYRIIGGTRFFDRKEIKDMLAYLWVIHNPSDSLRLKRIINVPARRIGSKLVETLEQLAVETSLPMFEVMRLADRFPELHSSLPHIQRFVEMIESLQELSKNGKMSELYDQLVSKSGYVDALIAGNKEESQSQIENIWELKTNIVEFESREESPGLSEFLDEISLFTDLETLDGQTDAVVMMTIHSAKGLEFPTVFVCGLEEGIFPGFRSMGLEEEIEEERRLMYVATTRAKRTLYMTHATSRMLFGQTSYNKPSRFLEEIPQELIEHVFPTGFHSQASKPAVASRPRASYQSQTANSSFAAKKPTGSNPFQAGSRLRHKTFGAGLVVSAKPIGGDCLLEIAFDTAGTKRLLYNTAAQYLEKE